MKSNKDNSDYLILKKCEKCGQETMHHNNRCSYCLLKEIIFGEKN